MIRRLLLTFIAIFVATSCSELETQVRIPFVAQFDGMEISCSQLATAPSLSDLRLFVSSLRAIRDDGVAVELVLQPDGQWQQPNLALLDLEDGSGACDNGTPATNTVLRGTLPAGQYRGLRFTIGVPFKLNHGDPLFAAAPLDNTAMHWHWRAGYKFMRAGIRSADDSFWIHLGSTGCEGTVQNITGCRSPNRVEVLLAEFVPGDDSVVVDLAALLSETNLQDAAATDCSSGPSEQSCDAPFRALGLDFASGSSLDTQSVFVRRAGQ